MLASVHRTDGPRRVRPESNAANQRQIRAIRESNARDSGFALARAVRDEAAIVPVTDRTAHGRYQKFIGLI
jgi:hypothetical protein